MQVDWYKIKTYGFPTYFAAYNKLLLLYRGFEGDKTVPVVLK